jgi:fermentation-respiration switch protein FrsA (DUF1100 family)
MHHRAIFLLLLVGLGSCSFNKMFLHPQPIPANVTKLRFTNPETKDTTILHLGGSNLQPDFRDERDQPKHTNYAIESQFIPSTSGNKVHSWFIKPITDVLPRGTILFLHGNAGNILSHMDGALPFVQRGYQVLIIDYSGFGFSSGKATVRNTREDANSALKWLSQRPEVKEGKLLIYGQSFGGHLAAVVAQENEQAVDGVIIEGAFSSQKDIAQTHAGFLGPVLVKQHYSGKSSLAKFHKPVLIIHSTEDETIPLPHGKRLYGAANQPKEFYEIKHAHIMGPTFYADSIASRMSRMFGT